MANPGTEVLLSVYPIPSNLIDKAMLRRLASSAGSLLAAALVFGVGCAPASIECDVKNEACRNDAFESVAEFLGAPDAEQPPVRVLSEDEFSEDLRNDPGLAGDENTDRWLQLSMRFGTSRTQRAGSGWHSIA